MGKYIKKKPEEKKKPGPKPKYCHEYNEMAYKFCLLGATEKELARLFHVSHDAIEDWKIQYPNFFEAMKEGRDIADANVSHSLYRRATGYKTESVKVFYDAKTGKEKIVRYEENVQPDVGAIVFWLKNRQREHWRDRIDQDIKQEGGGVVVQLVRYSDTEDNKK